MSASQGVDHTNTVFAWSYSIAIILTFQKRGILNAETQSNIFPKNNNKIAKTALSCL